jgi:opacity protein-like surface antigen
MVSALARGGVLLDPVDYVYLLGGWTYGRFEFGQSFGLNGATIGAGWERQVAPGWTLRAEGRYTKFETKTLTTNFTSNTASISTNAGVPTAAFNITNTDNASDRISADMWSVWLGFAHTFN